MLIGVEEIDRKYEVLGKLGEGGMGTVYKVRHRYLDELRVIKTIRPQLQVDEDLQQRFLREAQVAAKLRHPHIAIIHDFSVGKDGAAYIAMEYIEGKNVRDYQRTEEPLAVPQVIEVGRQALDALGYLHSKKFIHRDISSDNMMLSWGEGRMEVKLIDLGLAKSLRNEQQWQTRTGMLVGKVRYISPEQLSVGSGVEIDHRSDLYSFGVVLYELLTHEFPIAGDDEMSMIAGHLHRPPKSFEETDPEAKVPAPLRQVILKALEKSPGNRFASAEEFSRALSAGVLGTAATSVGRTTVLGTDAGELGTQPLSPATEDLPETIQGVRGAGSGADGEPAGAQTATLVTAAGGQLAATVALDSSAPATPVAKAGRRPLPAGVLAAVAAVVIVAVVVGWLAVERGRDSSATVPPPAGAAADVFFGTNHALVIGNNNYRELPLLETAVNDARAVADLLERRYDFEVRLLEDVDRTQILTALNDLHTSLTARDNLLIYYAGHGSLQGQSEYWQAIDAEPDRTTNWISTRYEISGAFSDSAARHILVVADSCYSGAMAGTGAPVPTLGEGAGEALGDEQIRDLVRRTSRLVLTSGGLSPVLDTGDARHSLFARVLLESLRANSRVVGVSQLFPAIRREVSKTAVERGGEQVPVLAPIPNSHDEGGEFFFVPAASAVG